MKKGVGIVVLFLVLVSLSFVSAQGSGACQRDIPRCSDGSLGFYDPTSCEASCWDSSEHPVWHDAEDIRSSLQEWFDGETGTWDDSEHAQSHLLSDIRVERDEGDVSLEDWVEERFDNPWVDNGDWHYARDVRVLISESMADLQSWINFMGDEDPVAGTTPEVYLFFEEEDVVTLMVHGHEEFLNVDSPSGLFKRKKAVYANADSVEGVSQQFIIFENANDGNKEIESDEAIDLVSVETANGLKYVDNSFQHIHARSFDEAPFWEDYDEFSPKIVKHVGSGRIECGDIVYFEDGDKYLDVDFSQSPPLAQRNEKLLFVIYDESGDCASIIDEGGLGDGGIDEPSGGVDTLTESGDRFFRLPDGQDGNEADTENYVQSCVGGGEDAKAGDGESEARVEYVVAKRLTGVSLRDGDEYQFSCTYGSETNEQIYTPELSSEYSLIALGTEPHYGYSGLGGFPAESSIEGEDTFGFYVRLNGQGDLEFEIRTVESCLEERVNHYTCTGGLPPNNRCFPIVGYETHCSVSDICPAYRLPSPLLDIGGKIWYQWDELLCEVEDLGEVA